MRGARVDARWNVAGVRTQVTPAGTLGCWGGAIKRNVAALDGLQRVVNPAWQSCAPRPATPRPVRTHASTGMILGLGSYSGCVPAARLRYHYGDLSQPPRLVRH